MIDLWQLLVINVFQSFWASLVGVSVIFIIMFMFSKVSPATMGYFIAVFFFAMSIGYGYVVLAILICITLIIISIGAGTRIVNSFQQG